MRCTSIEFRNYKTLGQFSVRFDELTILVGTNNCGKSTIIGAFRILEVAVRRAGSRRPTTVLSPKGYETGYALEESSIPVSLENVHTDYADTGSSVAFRFEGNKRLTLFFPPDGGCNLIPDADGRPIRGTSDFKAAFPLEICCVPVLGPLEDNEEVLEPETVRRSLSTHRASRHFRNYWLLHEDEFDAFAQLVRNTWPGMDIRPPERVSKLDNALAMYCTEERIAREVYWAGFGFQIWLQLLTHFERGRNADILLVDEPEIYLHPGVQRRLLGILRELGPQIILATHSGEIVSEADPEEVVAVRKGAPSGKRLRDMDGVQGVLDVIGSGQHVRLAQLGRDRRMVFVEDEDDLFFLKRVGSALGGQVLAGEQGYLPMFTRGFGSWERIAGLAEGLRELVREGLRVALVLDRDFWSQDELDTIRQRIGTGVGFLRFLPRKEHENFLLDSEVLAHAVRRSGMRGGQDLPPEELVSQISSIVDEVARGLKSDALSQYIGKRVEYTKRAGRDPASATLDVLGWFEPQWETREGRLTLMPGKRALSQVRARLQADFGVAPSDRRLIDALVAVGVPDSLRNIVLELDSFISLEEESRP